jgi:GNAT superfamily N-acetyltransferase
VHLRPFRTRDQDATRAVILDGFRERFGDLDPTLNRDLDDITSSYPGEGHTFLVIEDHAQILATGARKRAGAHAEIVRVSVRATHRRTGIGTRITEALVREAQRANAPRVVVKTSFPEAIALYERCGFLRTGTDGSDAVLELDLSDRAGGTSAGPSPWEGPSPSAGPSPWEGPLPLPRRGHDLRQWRPYRRRTE